MKTRYIFWSITGIVVVGIVFFSMLFVHGIPPASRTQLAMHMCKRRIQRYAFEHNALPSSLSETKKNDGYDDLLKDAWRHEIIYTVDVNGSVILTSFGKDNKPGGTGDNKDMVGIYPYRQKNGQWSDEFVDWTTDPFEPFRNRK